MDDQTDFHRLADDLSGNACDLAADLDWLAEILQARLSAYFADPSNSPQLPGELSPPDIASSHSPYARFLHEQCFTHAERLILILALSPLLRPQLLDVLLTRNDSTQRIFTEFGGIANAIGGFIPSVETACFLISGDDLGGRLATLQLLKSKLTTVNAIDLPPPQPGETLFSAALQPSSWLIEMVLQHRSFDTVDMSLPVQHVQTKLEWGDLVLPADTLEQLDEVRIWLQHGSTLMNEWGMDTKLRGGYTSLFHGSSGTGKTLAASLLGKLCKCEVYKIDLSMVVSKYIGETEKNLARIFNEGTLRNWLLFFDEADALFGKRTHVESAHDRYANQEVSFLLQRIEEYSGVTILATNFKNNMDEAFLRRFQSVIHFPLPSKEERVKIWREAFSAKSTLEETISLDRIAAQYELSGGAIMNVVRFASLKALSRGNNIILARDIEDGIQRELVKEGRAF